MNSIGYIRLHSDTKSAQNQTIVENCLFFKHTPHFSEAVYRIYRQSVLYQSTVLSRSVNNYSDAVQIDSTIPICK